MPTNLKSLKDFFWFFIRQQKIGFLLLLPSALGWAMQESLFPYFIQLVIDKSTKATKDTLWENLGPTLLFWLCLWIMIEIGFRTYDFVSARIYPKFQASIRKSMLEYTLKHSHTYFAENFAGTLASRISRMSDSMLQIIIMAITVFLPVILAFFINAAVLYQAKPFFGMVSIAWFLLHFSISLLFTRQCARYSAIQSDAVTALNGNIVDTLSNIINVRLFTNFRYEMNYFSKYQNKEAQKNYNLLHYNALMKLCLGMASLAFCITMVVLGIYSYQKDWISLGELALVLTSLNLIGLAWYMGMHLISLFQEVGTCEEAFTLIQHPHEIIDQKNAKELIVTRGEIKFDKVTFRYSRNRNLFENKTVVIHPKEKVGLVGFSGSGKTTFVNLILRYFEPTSGRILIDNQDIQTVTQDSLRHNISLIPQDPTLFHRTLFDNIRYGNFDASDREVIEASKRAHCHEFIEHLEQGYETLVGERGTKLSGGQRQRIAIARAILKNAPILILDEATSALDSLTEKYIQEALHDLMQQSTTIVIAHRLSTLSGMDRILVFKAGQIIEEGTHESLLHAKGHYATLWSMQAGGFLPDLDT